jgi:hypothetical protein
MQGYYLHCCIRYAVLFICLAAVIMGTAVSTVPFVLSFLNFLMWRRVYLREGVISSLLCIFMSDGY